MLIPSIDLSLGKAVQLRQGREKVLERTDIEALADTFSRFGEIAVVDLDAASGRGENEELVLGLCRRVECRVGGGIRSPEKAERLIEHGATKVIVGTRAFGRAGVDSGFLADLVRAVGRERIVIALDNIRGRVVVDGWRKDAGLDVESAIKDAEPYASEFLLTSVDREGMMAGTDAEFVRRILASTRLPVTAAGGVSTLAEVEELAALGARVQVGMALYTGAFSVEDAFSASIDWKKGGGLVPTVVQDTASQVLMVAWSTRESLSRTFRSGRGCYYSRSRRALWRKGETSGNDQEFVRIRADCDGDALLLTVRQRGAACHTGMYSCFGDRVFSPGELFEVIRERIARPPAGSYTASLTATRAADKIMEEAAELVSSVEPGETRWEAADLLYFILVFLARKGILLEDVYTELKRRRRSPGLRNSAKRRKEP